MAGRKLSLMEFVSSAPGQWRADTRVSCSSAKRPSAGNHNRKGGFLGKGNGKRETGSGKQEAGNRKQETEGIWEVFNHSRGGIHD